CEKPRISGLFPIYLTLFDLVAGTLLSKVRFLPDESSGSGFLMEGNFYEQERTGVRCRRCREYFEG
ncbi:hypothetical protein, partial [Mesorhizobium sanjuanii]|uniref:hypothetical protein n=1 Tax=Mesorhizobium sanjuanii TaxID=2037900 RepID=UPI001AD7EFE1